MIRLRKGASKRELTYLQINSHSSKFSLQNNETSLCRSLRCLNETPTKKARTFFLLSVSFWNLKIKI